MTAGGTASTPACGPVRSNLEWLESDGIGGFASGTADGIRTRRYQALLLSATTPPTGRMVLVNGLEAWVDGDSGRSALSSQRYAADLVHPDARPLIASFSLDPWPMWLFRLPDGTEIRHEVLVEPHSCETVLRWRRTAGTGACRLAVRPLLSGRDLGDLHHENSGFCFDAAVGDSSVVWRPYPGVPATAALTDGAYRHDPVWYRNFFYTVEHERGLDDTEDLASPGLFSFDLEARPATIVLRAGDGTAVDLVRHADDLMAAELARRSACSSDLCRSAASYRTARGRGRTIMAGFPWFTDWGRDTFISLRGLCLTTGRRDEARAILQAWAGMVDRGMLPNRYPDRGSAPEFNAVDASLWFIVAIHDTLDACVAAGEPMPPTEETRLRRAAEQILEGYARGTRFGIRADHDGLITAGIAGVQLTWMDALTNGHVITPRIGKPVEVQALWVNALHIAATRWSDGWAPYEARARAGFAERFPDPAGGLYDVVDVDGVAGTVDAKLRPNQILAAGGLPVRLVDGEAARRLVDRVEAKLLTPLGLRTLSPDDPNYIGRYAGDLVARDRAYHQGTAWPWLMGPFVDAWLTVRGRTEAAKAEAVSRFLQPLEDHVGEVGLGHITEVADGDAPHTPGGCPFQAWSLGEYIRIRSMLGRNV